MMIMIWMLLMVTPPEAMIWPIFEVGDATPSAVAAGVISATPLETISPPFSMA